MINHFSAASEQSHSINDVYTTEHVLFLHYMVHSVHTMKGTHYKTYSIPWCNAVC